MANDININESAILETLNAKIDYDGGNYKGSGLERTVNSTRVSKSGDTMTGDLTINKSTNTWPTINFIGKGTMGETSDTVQYGARLISRDTRNQYFATYEHLIAENGRARVYMVARSTNDNGATYSSRRLEVACWPDGSGGTYIDNKLLKAFVTQTYVSGTSWYRVWSDGWCEQGGRTGSSAGGTARTVTLLKEFSDTNYYVGLTSYTGGSGSVQYNNFQCTNKTTSNFTAKAGCNESLVLEWQACGYIA